MPTYEYACKKCGETFDVYQSFDDEPMKKHKGCGGAVRRVFGSVGIAFKGSGFYKNDSRSSTAKSASASSESSESSSTSDSAAASTSTDKPAAADKADKAEKKEKKAEKADKKPAKAATK